MTDMIHASSLSLGPLLLMVLAAGTATTTATATAGTHTISNSNPSLQTQSCVPRAALSTSNERDDVGGPTKKKKKTATPRGSGWSWRWGCGQYMANGGRKTCWIKPLMALKICQFLVFVLYKYIQFNQAPSLATCPFPRMFTPSAPPEPLCAYAFRTEMVG